MQMPARTPAMTAMTAMSLDALSGGRFILGLGPSGPQVVEGWHGVAYGKPLTRTREYIAIVRKILAREAPLEFKGEHYQIPYAGPGRDGPRQAAEEHPPRPEGPPDLHRLDRPEGRRDERRGRRRPDPGLDEPRALRPARARTSTPASRRRAAGQAPRRLRVAPFVTCVDRRRPRTLPHAGEGHARALHRRHGRARQELLQRLREAPRLRGRGREDPGPLPRREEGRGDGRGARRARRRDRAGRPEGAHRRAARGLEARRA